ncbi:MAG TPA: NAD-dependent epimerase/dehydratase family protein [Candidatus Thiothrix moscowensis]|uniref:NAD-dependent epimerase/dehydratase family protein n=1 Tax=unclassified Thiothrix TaxID=2636184 RepID=UPI0025D93C8A|nr:MULTISPECIES: NAD-dependent epimerase/dehydratase family protein [unclassified Thiothrix]HRJ54149.1 NAD-dependent epimerase/dehydratase family protein [Candidatus Thiothrix moscowensis]HRJ94359.1 NAD-dependent epimerase/dehydratase family protein [Candidatus Thiothrix moscowensis]
MSKCLIVGGGGFIGSHLVELILKRNNKKLIVAGRHEKPKTLINKNIEYVCIDPSNLEGLSQVMDQCDEVIDLAYATVPKTSFDDPILDISANLPFTVNLLKLASQKSLRRFMLVSSGGTVYGTPLRLPIDETHPTNPLSPYGITKLATEKYGLMYHHFQSLPLLIVRPSNPYGPGQRGNIGQGFVSTALFAGKKQKTVKMFGERGTIRDYIYIKDLVEGILAALENGIPGEIYNIGTGIGMDNRTILEKINHHIKLDGFSLDIEVLPLRPFDVSSNVLSAAKLTYISGWRSQTSFEEGLAATWKWVKESTP